MKFYHSGVNRMQRKRSVLIPVSLSSFNSLAYLCCDAILLFWRVLILSSLASLCCGVSAANLSFRLVRFLWSLASFCSLLSASLLSLFASFTVCSFFEAVSGARWALTLSLRCWSLLSLYSRTLGRLESMLILSKVDTACSIATMHSMV